MITSTMHGIRAGNLAFRGLFNWSSPGMYVGTLLIAPLGQMTFFALLGNQLGVADFAFYVYANSVFAAAKVGLFGAAMSIGNERRYGTLPYLLMTRLAPLRLCASRLFPFVVHGIVAGSVSLVLGLALFAVQVTDFKFILGQILVFAAVSFSVGSVGLILGVFGLIVRDIFVGTNILQVLFLFVAGVQIPFASLPAGVQAVGTFWPVTHGILASVSLGSQKDLTQFAAEIATEVLLGFVAFGIAVISFSAIRAQSRRTGLLDGL